ncbi:hypothetical protein JCM10450v2_002950 [Rhodotorula kratochvilovae]
MSTQNTPLPLHNPPQAGRTDGAQQRRASPWSYYLRVPQQGTKAYAAKNHGLAMVGEFVGTFMFLFFAFGAAQVANQAATSVTGVTTTGPGGVAVGGGNTSSLFYISMGFGLSLLVNAWVFFRVSGSAFNPAVSFALALVGAITPLRAVLLVPAQLLGGICAAAVIDALMPGPLLVATTLAPGMSIVRGLFLEMFMTSLLIITILLLAGERHRVTPFSPVGIGLALAIIHLVGVYWTGCGVNPARSMGPQVASASFPGYAWIYYLGPAMGAALAAGFYKLLKALQYETVLGEEGGDLSTARMTSELVREHLALSGQLSPTAGGGAPAAQHEQYGGGGKGHEVQGPGLSDLLTRKPSVDAGGGYSAPSSPTTLVGGYGGPGGASGIDQRFDRLEMMVQQLVNRGGAARPGVLGRMASNEGTLVEEPRGMVCPIGEK